MNISVGTLSKHPTRGEVCVQVIVSDGTGKSFGPIEVPLINNSDGTIEPALFWYDNPPDMPASGSDIRKRVIEFIAKHHEIVAAKFGE